MSARWDEDKHARGRARLNKDLQVSQRRAQWDLELDLGEVNE